VDGQEVCLVNYGDIWGTCDKAAGSDGTPGPRIAQA
jgi:hypothetical protein